MASEGLCGACLTKEARIRELEGQMARLMEGLDQARQALELRQAEDGQAKAEAKAEAIEQMHLLLVRSLIQR